MPRTHVPTRHIISVSFELFIRGYEVLKTGDTRLELWMLELGNTQISVCNGHHHSRKKCLLL